MHKNLDDYIQNLSVLLLMKDKTEEEIAKLEQYEAFIVENAESLLKELEFSGELNVLSAKDCQEVSMDFEKTPSQRHPMLTTILQCEGGIKLLQKENPQLYDTCFSQRKLPEIKKEKFLIKEGDIEVSALKESQSTSSSSDSNLPPPINLLWQEEKNPKMFRSALLLDANTSIEDCQKIDPALHHQCFENSQSK